MLQAVRALCFDLDDTFWDVQRVLARAEGRVAEFLAQHYPRLASLDREQHRAARIELAREAPQRSHDLTWLRTEAMRRLARTAGYPDAVGEQAFALGAREVLEASFDTKRQLWNLVRSAAGAHLDPIREPVEVGFERRQFLTQLRMKQGEHFLFLVGGADDAQVRFRIHAGHFLVKHPIAPAKDGRRPGSSRSQAPPGNALPGRLCPAQ